jgi:hypothetical protein
MIGAALLWGGLGLGVQDRLAEFKAAFEAASDDRERVRAFERLAGETGPALVEEMASLLTRGSDRVRLGAAAVLAAQRESGAAARVLLEAIPLQRSRSVQGELLRAFGATNAVGLARWLEPYVRDPDPELARAAAQAAGSLRRAELVMPLILRLAEVEGELAGAAAAAADDPRVLLRDACRTALAQATGQALDSARAYAAWWKRHRPPSP